jgi:CBS domain containing-hemolysin-like protein
MDKEKQSRQDKLQELRAALGALEGDDKKNYIEKIEKQAELYLQEQLKAALAITQRAITLAAIFGAVVAATLGLAASVVSKTGFSSYYLPIALLVIALLISLSKIVTAAKPADFYYAGSNPVLWLKDITARLDFQTAQIAQIKLYSESISDNNENLRVSRDNIDSGLRAAKWGLVLFIVSSLLSALIYVSKHGISG